MAGLDAEDAQDGAVEALGGREVRDGDADVVKHSAEATVAGLPGREPTGFCRRCRVKAKQLHVRSPRAELRLNTSPSESTLPMLADDANVDADGRAERARDRKPGRIRRLLRRHRRSPTNQRLAAALAARRTEFDRRVKAAQARSGTSESPAWSTAGLDLLDKAERALGRGEFDAAWAYIQAAERLEILDYDGHEIWAAQTAIRNEAEQKLSSWRAKTVADLLVGDSASREERIGRLVGDFVDDSPTGQEVAALLVGHCEGDNVRRVAHLLQERRVPRPDAAARLLMELARTHVAADRASLSVATLMRDEDAQNTYRRLGWRRRQMLIVGAVVALALVAVLALVVWRPISLDTQADFSSERAWLWVLVFGTLGGCLSALQSFSTSSTASRIPEVIHHGLLTAARPLIGAAAAMAAYVLLASGVVQFASDTNAAVLAVAFAAGFSERFVVRALESLGS
jgi:hypothetical protein